MSHLRDRREAKGLSQSQLAKAVGISVRSIQAYEQGLKDINRAHAMTVFALADALGCQVADLLEFEKNDCSLVESLGGRR